MFTECSLNVPATDGGGDGAGQRGAEKRSVGGQPAGGALENAEFQLYIDLLRDKGAHHRLLHESLITYIIASG
jgi:hypothetical protein